MYRPKERGDGYGPPYKNPPIWQSTIARDCTAEKEENTYILDWISKAAHAAPYTTSDILTNSTHARIGHPKTTAHSVRSQKAWKSYRGRDTAKSKQGKRASIHSLAIEASSRCSNSQRRLLFHFFFNPAQGVSSKHTVVTIAITIVTFSTGWPPFFSIPEGWYTT